MASAGVNREPNISEVKSGKVAEFFRNPAEYFRDNWENVLRRGVAGVFGTVSGAALIYTTYEIGPSLLKLPHYQIVTLGMVSMSIGISAGVLAYSSLKYAVNGPNKK